MRKSCQTMEVMLLRVDETDESEPQNTAAKNKPDEPLMLSRRSCMK